MREIKFRGWDTTNKEMLPIITLGEMLDFGFNEIDNVEFEQFTGLHDKNGTEIYEGDILQYTMPSGKISTIKFLVEWEQQGLRFKGIVLKPIYDIEVIGNIHENPELLNPSTDAKPQE